MWIIENHLNLIREFKSYNTSSKGKEGTSIISSYLLIMKRILLLLLITSIIGIPVSLAQTTISGMVKDKSDNTPLEQVGIRLLSVRDSTLIAGATTNRNGYFTLSQIKPGNYIIAFTYIGYNTYYKNVSANSQSTKRNIGIIYMSPSDIMLKLSLIHI